MLKNVKSEFFTRLIFSFIIEKQKLKLVKYNKSLQKIIDLSLFNYRHFLGRYIIYESKLKKYGKEYNGYDDGLIYKGEYLNEKKNGKGKEFDRYYKKKNLKENI